MSSPVANLLRCDFASIHYGHLASVVQYQNQRGEHEEIAVVTEHGKALNQAATYHIDEVIDPAETRRWIVAGLRSLPAAGKRREKKLRWIDAW